MTETQPIAAPQLQPPVPLPPAPANWKSETLMQGSREITIEHGDQVYRLRLTRNGKLILGK